MKKIGKNFVDFYAHTNCSLTCFVNATKFPFTHKFLEKNWLGKTLLQKIETNKALIYILYVDFPNAFHMFLIWIAVQNETLVAATVAVVATNFALNVLNSLNLFVINVIITTIRLVLYFVLHSNSTGHNESNVNRHPLWVLTFVYTNFVHSKSPTRMRAQTQYCRMAAHNLIKKNPLGNRGSSWNIQMNWMHIITMHNAVCGYKRKP